MHQDFWGQLGEALLMAAGMFWDVGWSLVLGSTRWSTGITTEKVRAGPTTIIMPSNNVTATSKGEPCALES